MHENGTSDHASEEEIVRQKVNETNAPSAACSDAPVCGNRHGSGRVIGSKLKERTGESVTEKDGADIFSSGLLKPVSQKMLDHLRKHLIVRENDDGDDDVTFDGRGKQQKNNPSPSSTAPPQSLIIPVIPEGPSARASLIPTLQNVIATVNLSSSLDLNKITFWTRNSEYNPARFSGVIMRIREPCTTALIFSSGKIVITGARSESAAYLAARKYARIIQKIGFNIKFQNFKIQNMMGTYDLKFPIRIESLHQKHGQFCRYEPEVFPGLIYRLVKPSVVLFIFVNGKIVINGAKSREDLKHALEAMFPVLESFKKM